MNLKTQTEMLLKEYEKNVPEEDWKIISLATENLKSSINNQRYIQKGNLFPDTTLKNIEFKYEQLSSYFKDNDYVVVSFYRGSWCTFCNLEIIYLNNKYKEFKDLKTEVIVISPENIEDSKKLIKELGINLKVFQDENNMLANQLGLVFNVPDDLNKIYLDKFNINLKKSNNTNENTLPITATYIINKYGNIIDSFIDEDFTNRMEPEEILNIIKKNIEAV